MKNLTRTALSIRKETLIKFMRPLLGAIAIAAIALPSACGGDGGGGDGNGGGPVVPPPSDLTVIHLTGSLRFSPSQVTIPRGRRVRWVNDQTIFHTVTPDGQDEWERQILTQAGEMFEHVFDDAGTFRYFCEPHFTVGMTGSITVQ